MLFLMRALIVCATLLGLAASKTATAAWSNNPNLNLPVVTGASDQAAPHVLADGTGGLFVTWTTGTGGNFDIYVQRLDAQGAPLWALPGVPVCTAPADQLGSWMVPDGAGGVIVVWNDSRTGSNYDIYAQRVNGAGGTLWTNNGVPVASGVGDQSNPQAISDGTGGALLTWMDSRGANLDIYAQRINASGVGQWSLNGVPVCAATGNQDSPLLVPDAAGGAIIAWVDNRVAGSDIYAQRVDGSGARLWALNGVPVCAAANSQSTPSMSSDEAGGSYLAWQDYRAGAIGHVFLQRINGSGTVLWTVDGIKVTPEPNGGLKPKIISDGAGGCVVAWEDYRGTENPDLYAQRYAASGASLWIAGGTPLCVMVAGQFFGALLGDGLGGVMAVWEDYRAGGGSNDLYAQRVSGSGAIRWTPNGAALSTAAKDQFAPSLATDGNGGLIAVFTDRRNAANADLYAQNIERFGQLGVPAPDIASVRDVANDQGGQVRVSWTSSYLDQGPGSVVDVYRLWRQVPSSLARQQLARGALLVGPGEALAAGATERPLLRAAEGMTAYYWELVATQAANGFAGYSLLAATEGDSVAGSNPRTVFMVEAVQSSTGNYWDSPPDSGYSVDNLAPPAPSPFTGTYSDLTAYLQWGSSPAPDLSHYRLYRGGTSDFVPGPGNLILSSLTTSYVDPAGGPSWYKLSAVDVHGNEGPYASLFPTGAVGVADGGTPMALVLGRPSPNPMRDRTAFLLELPRAGRVRAAVYDQQGRLLRSLSDRELPAGKHALVWEGRLEDGSPAPSGVYFYRIEVEGRRILGRLALVR